MPYITAEQELTKKNKNSNGGNSNVKTTAELQVLDKPCPFCHFLIWKSDKNIIETLHGTAHAICPVDFFLRNFKNAGLIRREVRIVDFYKIPPLLEFLNKTYEDKWLNMAYSGKEITKEEAKEIDGKMQVLAWASRMFLEQKELAVVRGKNTELRKAANL